MTKLDPASASAVLEMSLAEYSDIRRALWAGVFDAVDGFMNGKLTLRQFKTAVYKAIDVNYHSTARLAWEDGESNQPRLSDDAKAWLRSRILEEKTYVTSLAFRLKSILAEPDDELSYIHESFARADGYAASLDAVYANIKAMSADKLMLTFGGFDGKESCKDCQRYKGQRHRARWWVAHAAVPPSRDFECHGYRCQHVLMRDNGSLFTI